MACDSTWAFLSAAGWQITRLIALSASGQSYRVAVFADRHVQCVDASLPFAVLHQSQPGRLVPVQVAGLPWPGVCVGQKLLALQLNSIATLMPSAGMTQGIMSYSEPIGWS